jgi:hypothetical protein
VDQFTPKEVQNRNKKLAVRKAKPSSGMRFKANNSGVVFCWKFQISDKGFY